MRLLVVTADDFGLCGAVNRGIARAHDHGIVTAASLMVRQPSVPEAAAMARARPRLSVGLHLDIAEWEHGSEGWRRRYEVVDATDPVALRSEMRSQLVRFRELIGADPTHLDTHQHVHRELPVAEAVEELGAELGVPVRELTAGVEYCGAFYGQGAGGGPCHEQLRTDALFGILSRLRGCVTELGCHPADGDVPSSYGVERALELLTLCDPRVRDAVEWMGFRLVSFRDVAEVVLPRRSPAP